MRDALAVGTSTSAILIARDEKEQNRMMLHHTEQHSKNIVLKRNTKNNYSKFDSHAKKKENPLK